MLFTKMPDNSSAIQNQKTCIKNYYTSMKLNDINCCNFFQTKSSSIFEIPKKKKNLFHLQTLNIHIYTNTKIIKFPKLSLIPNSNFQIYFIFLHGLISPRFLFSFNFEFSRNNSCCVSREGLPFSHTYPAMVIPRP